MFNGKVSFVAKINGTGLTFPSFEFISNVPGADKVEIKGPKGDEIRSTVHVASVATHDEGRSLAAKVNTHAVNRIAFFHSIAIENARSTGDSFSPLKTQHGVHAEAATVTMFMEVGGDDKLSIPADRLKTELEEQAPPGEQNFGFFRAALQSVSPVEKFMHLYNILLMLYNDLQADVDAFIVGEDPAVPQTQCPHKGMGIMETIYTRLRNEFAHRRAGANLDNTKDEMAKRLGALVVLTKRAIELHP